MVAFFYISPKENICCLIQLLICQLHLIIQVSVGRVNSIIKSTQGQQKKMKKKGKDNVEL